jgi:hypothetical protein
MARDSLLDSLPMIFVESGLDQISEKLSRLRDLLKGGQSRRPFVERQSVGTSSPGIECPDQSIFKLSDSILQSKDCFEDLLFVLDFQGVRSEQVLHMQRNLGGGLREETAQHPDDLERGSQNNEAGIPIG